MEVIESTFNKMAPEVHLICSILPKESKFCITLKHSFRAGIYELSYVVFCQRLALPPGTMWDQDLSGLVAQFFLPVATEEQDRPGQCGPLGQHLDSHLWLELEPRSFAHAWGWWWGGGEPTLAWVPTQPPRCATEGHRAPTCCVLSSFTAVKL